MLKYLRCKFYRINHINGMKSIIAEFKIRNDLNFYVTEQKIFTSKIVIL